MLVAVASSRRARVPAATRRDFVCAACGKDLGSSEALRSHRHRSGTCSKRWRCVVAGCDETLVTLTEKRVSHLKDHVWSEMMSCLVGDVHKSRKLTFLNGFASFTVLEDHLLLKLLDASDARRVTYEGRKTFFSAKNGFGPGEWVGLICSTARNGDGRKPEHAGCLMALALLGDNSPSVHPGDTYLYHYHFEHLIMVRRPKDHRAAGGEFKGGQGPGVPRINLSKHEVLAKELLADMEAYVLAKARRVYDAPRIRLCPAGIPCPPNPTHWPVGRGIV